MARIRILSPVGVVASQATAVPPLPREWAGRTVGFLDNTKSNFDRLVTDLGELLRERYGVAAIVHRKKANASTPATAELIDELAKQCDVVFAGSAD
jgi:citrate lyase synthetase